MKLYIFLPFLILSACAYPTKKEPFKEQSPDKGMAVVYIYRSQTSVDSVNPDVPRFYVNDNLIGKLSIGGYYRVIVNPGKIHVTFRDSLFGIPLFWTSGSVEIEVAENKSYFVKFGIEGMSRVEQFKLVHDVVGMREIQKTRLLVN